MPGPAKLPKRKPKPHTSGASTSAPTPEPPTKTRHKQVQKRPAAQVGLGQFCVGVVKPSA